MPNFNIILGGDEDARIVISKAGDADVAVYLGYAEHDGVPYVIFDTEEHAKLRVHLNDGALLAVHDGHKVTLPEHWHEYIKPEDGLPTKDRSTYTVEVTRSVTTTVDVEADSPEAAAARVDKANFPLPPLHEWQGHKDWRYVVTDGEGHNVYDSED